MVRTFRGKAWMDWVRFLIFGGCTVGMLAIGIVEINGFTDANGVVRHDATVPCLTVAPICGVIAVMFLLNAIARSLPVVEFYREGIACRMVGRAHDLNLSGKVGLAVAVFSGRGFRQYIYRIKWADFAGVTITGVPMMYALHLHGAAIDQHGKTTNELTFAQHEFSHDLREVAYVIDQFAQSSEEQRKLPAWSRMHV